MLLHAVIAAAMAAIPTWTMPGTAGTDDKQPGGTVTVVTGCNANDVGETCVGTVAAVSGGSSVSVVGGVVGGVLTYTVNGPGVTTIDITVTDSGGETNTQTLTITVVPVNDPPQITLGGVGCTRNAATPCASPPSAPEDSTAQIVAGFFEFDTADTSPGQTITRKDITCTPGSYPGGPTFFATPPTATGCSMVGTVERCDLSYEVAGDEFSEGRSPGEISCSLVVEDDGGVGVCNGVANCDTTTAEFTLQITPVNDKPTVTSNPSFNIDLVEDCACGWPAWCTGAAPQLQASGLFTSVSPGPYNEVNQVVTVKAGGVTVSDPTAFDAIPVGSNLNANGDATGDVVHVDDMGNIYFTPAAHRTGVYTVTVVLQDDGEVPCATPCTMPLSPDNQPLDSDPITFTVTISDVNDPPFVELSTRVVNVDEDCAAQDIADFIREITSGQGRWAPVPFNYPTPDERPQIITLLDPTGPCPAGYMCASKLELIPPEAEALFSSVPVLDNTGPYTNLMRNTANLQFECAADRSTTHQNHVPCGLQPPNWNPNGVPNPATPPYWTTPTTPTLPNAPTGSVRVRMTFADDGGLSAGGCGVDGNTVEFDIVIHEKNDPPSYTLRAMPSLVIYEDSYGVDPGLGLECKSPLDADPRACQPEQPRELKIDNWLANFTTGNYWEDQFEKLTWIFTTDHGEYFYDGPKIDQYQCPFVDDMKSLRMTLEPHATGIATLYVDCVDNGVLPIKCGESVFTIEILPVNDPPDACPAMNSVSYEECDVVAGCVIEEEWLRNINPGGGVDERKQRVEAECDWGPKGTTAADKEKELFEGAVGLEVSSGIVSFTLKEYSQGNGWIHCTLKDDGGVSPTLTVNGSHCEMDEWSFTLDVHVAPINNPPTFDFGTHTNGMDLVIEEDSLAQTIKGFATKVSPSFDPHERNQQLVFTCNADDPGFFATQPGIVLDATSTEGDLTIEPAPDRHGTTVVRCTLTDDGSCTNKDCDSEDVFRVTILAVNDRPVLTLPSDTLRVYSGDAGVVPGVVVGSPGPFEDDQTLTYTTKILGGGADIFVQPPEVLADGSLQYATAPGVNGTVQVEIVGVDSGGGNNDTSEPVVLTIEVVAVNTPPTFTLKARDVYLQLTGLVSQTEVILESDAGTDQLRYVLSGYDTSLFTTPPEVTPEGVFITTAAATGVTAVTIQAVDDGAHCDPVNSTCRDNAMAPPQDFVVQIVDKLPLRFTKGETVTLPEDSPEWSEEWATGIASGDPAASLSFSLDEYDASAFVGPLRMTPDGVLTVRPAEDANGIFPFRVCLSDNAGGLLCKSSIITLTPVNDPPTFTLLKQELVVSDDTPTSHVEWVLGELLPGPPNEAGQDVTLSVQTGAGCEGVVVGQPVFSTDTVLSFETSGTAGTCPLVVIATDASGMSANDTMLLTVRQNPRPPSFTPSGDIVVRSGVLHMEAWAADIDEGTAPAAFTVSPYDPTVAGELFASGPEVLPNGTLVVTAKEAVEGSSVHYVALAGRDGEADVARLTITVIRGDAYVPPYWSVLGEVTAAEDQGRVVVQDFCMAGNVTPGYRLTVEVAVSDESVFAAQPALDLQGCSLTFETASNFFGDVPMSFELTDTVTVRQAATLLRVTPINDPPVYVIPEQNRLIHLQANSGRQVIPSFATGISAGPPNEAAVQYVSFTVLDIASYLPAPPVVELDGSLVVEVPTTQGSTVVHIKAQDSGTPSAQSVNTEVVHIAVSTVKLPVVLDVATGNTSPLQLRNDIAGLLNVPVSRVAVEAWGLGTATVSFVEPQQVGQKGYMELLEEFVSTPVSVLNGVHVNEVRSAPVPGEGPVGSPYPTNGTDGGGGSSGGSSVSPLVIGVTVPAGLLLVAGVVELIRRHVVPEGIKAESIKSGSEPSPGSVSATSPDISIATDTQQHSSEVHMQDTTGSNPIENVFPRQ